MIRYFQGQLRCEDSCLYGRTEKDCVQNILVLHTTLSKDVYGRPTEGIFAIKERQGSFDIVVDRIIGLYTFVTHLNEGRYTYEVHEGPVQPDHPFQVMWCSIYFDKTVGYYRPKFLTKEAIQSIVQCFA